MKVYCKIAGDQLQYTFQTKICGANRLQEMKFLAVLRLIIINTINKENFMKLQKLLSYVRRAVDDSI